MIGRPIAMTPWSSTMTRTIATTTIPLPPSCPIQSQQATLLQEYKQQWFCQQPRRTPWTDGWTSEQRTNWLTNTPGPGPVQHQWLQQHANAIEYNGKQWWLSKSIITNRPTSRCIETSAITMQTNTMNILPPTPLLMLTPSGTMTNVNKRTTNGPTNQYTKTNTNNYDRHTTTNAIEYQHDQQQVRQCQHQQCQQPQHQPGSTSMPMFSLSSPLPSLPPPLPCHQCCCCDTGG